MAAIIERENRVCLKRNERLIMNALYLYEGNIGEREGKRHNTGIHHWGEKDQEGNFIMVHFMKHSYTAHRMTK